MQKQIYTILLLLALTTGANFLPSISVAQTTNSVGADEQLTKLKQDYADGKITLEEYQQKSNALLQSNIPVTGISVGTHLEKGGRCLIAGGILTILGVGAVASGPYIPYKTSDGNIVQMCVGGGIGLLGIILDIAGGSQLLKAGKKLNAAKGIGVSEIEFRPSEQGIGMAMNF